MRHIPPLKKKFVDSHRLGGEWGDTTRARTDSYGQNMYYREEDFVVADRVTEVAKRRGVSPSQIALAWVLGKPYVTAPIIGASRLEHLEESLAAVDIHLTPEEEAQLEEPYRLHPVLGHD